MQLAKLLTVFLMLFAKLVVFLLSHKENIRQKVYGFIISTSICMFHIHAHQLNEMAQSLLPPRTDDNLESLVFHLVKKSDNVSKYVRRLKEKAGIEKDLTYPCLMFKVTICDFGKMNINMTDKIEKKESSELTTESDQLVGVDNIEPLIKIIRGQQSMHIAEIRTVAKSLPPLR